MAGFHVAVVPVGKLQVADLEPAVTRAARQLKAPLEIRAPLRVPPGSEDRERRQHRAASLLERLRAEAAKLGPGTLYGSDDAEAKAPYRADAHIFVTDVDLFTAQTDGAIAAMARANKVAVVSVKRLREAYYRRPADHNKQRARVVKELIRMWGRLAGAPACADPSCALAPTKSTLDLDTKDERPCRRCEIRLHEGRVAL